ncbi:cAMP-binding domain of CRP or a regulatory subunit of cAMP-dependent protein kinases [Fulvimarina manganoxydans]|uniref:cAMP-binding domain of CRP or a regulatory subunit of cAMP-dependent protein kinases n=1 Tax=Fulvimarina manganoxydans TaxID=937218 RepID=A0A1W2ETX3_9HYPH|nr:Crp/Fnr family transcriptional regulator [Fulvimarina manganoxydans]SMD13163.1 cAMP-binding domain of CRP or a regulatory subunit of cAMP-dependent protein kinases [Fulvimarina manganoxydans]
MMYRSPFLDNLRSSLGSGFAEQSAIDELSSNITIVQKGGEVVPLGYKGRKLFVINSGIAMRYRILPDGGRQIFMFLMPGDACNPNLFNAIPVDHAIAAVTPLQVDQISHESMLALLKKIPQVNQALWQMADEQTAVMRDRIVSLGRCDARVRIAILLWELVSRLRVTNVDVLPIMIPITQALLADAVGMTHIHFNRVIKDFCRMEVLFTRRGRLFVTRPTFLENLAREQTGH